jgi:hypothetical protein
MILENFVHGAGHLSRKSDPEFLPQIMLEIRFTGGSDDFGLSPAVLFGNLKNCGFDVTGYAANLAMTSFTPVAR